MKIALVGPTPPPNGGMAMQTLQLQQLLSERGHQVTLISVNPNYRPAIAGRIPVIRSVFRLVPYLCRLLLVLRQHDIIHLMSNSGWAWYLFSAPVIHIAHIYNVPCIVNYRGGLADEFLSRAAKRVRFTMQRAAQLVVPSGFLVQVFDKYGIESEIVPNIVSPDLFHYHPPQLSHRPIHLIVTRNLEALYGNKYAIQALSIIAKKHREVHMTIAGDGPERRELEKLVQLQGLSNQIQFSGRLDRQQMADLYSTADIMINPTTADNMPNSLLEAMACGIPVVTTAVGGIPFMVEDKATALLVEPRNAQAIADAVMQLLQDAALTQRLSRNGIKQATQYMPDAVIPLWESCYNRHLNVC